MAKEIKGFVVYPELEQQTATMTDAQVGQLLRAMFQFNRGEDPAPADPLVGMAFAFVRPAMERDAAKYKATCEKRRAAGTKGGRPRKRREGDEPFFSPESNSFPGEQNNPTPTSTKTKTPTPTKTSTSTSTKVPLSEGVQGEDAGRRDEDEDAGNAQEIVENPVENVDDVKDVENYCKKCGLTINRPQRQKLAQFVRKMGFDVAVLAVDRAMVHGANSAAYPLAILEEWDRLGLHDVDAVDAHLDGEGAIA